VVKEFVGRTTTDPRIKLRFFNTDAVKLQQLLVEFVCKATGGPCEYTGRDMAEAHAGMELVDEEFGALVEDLVAALDKHSVPEREKGEILAALGPLASQMVVPAAKLKPIAAADLAKVEKLVATIKDPVAAETLAGAIAAGKRGQRSYAEQLFTRAEMLVGERKLAAAAKVFRAGAPPRVTAKATLAKSKAAQPAKLGNSEDDEPERRPQIGSLEGTMRLAGKPISGMGVVMLWPKGPYKKRIPKQRVIEQRDKIFAPHVMAVPVGSTVSFPNFDQVFHNVFSLSRSKPFDLGMYKTGEQREVKFDKAGIVRLGCNIHANMSAYLIVVDAPHYVVTERDGSFSFRSLKPGKYRAQAWTEQSATPTESELVIKVGANQATLDVAGGGTSAPSTNKFGDARK
jgi:plastocyanin/truncated hemoglobin YjbI